MIEDCHGCVYFFKRMERFDKGISVPVEGCVRDNDPDTCHEFTEKWYAGNEDGFQDSLEEQYDNGFMEEHLTIIILGS